jgi:DNA-binding winged helix-turn-helix (wHTH) protein/Tfp pilus assembly protein PilF
MAPAQMSPEVVRFGVFEADLRAGELRRNGAKVRIQDLPFRALTLLLTHPGGVITREEFRQSLWPADVFVDFEQGISSAIMRLRDALRDSADNPIFIETIERRGYRWIGPIQIPEPIAADSPASNTDQAVTVPQPASRFPWRILAFAIPVLALFFVLWIFRGSRRNAQAGALPNRGSGRTSHQAANHEAEDFYLKGRFYWNKRTPESLNQAVDSFTQAIVHDPGYSDAYMGLADCYNLLREFSVMPANEAYPKSFAAAKKAVELDPQSSAAYTSLAFVTYWGMWDPVDAEKEFRRALELDPNNAQTHHWYATFLHSESRHEDAMVQIELARKLDPNSPAILADKGALLWAGGQHQQGLQLLQQLVAADPNFVSPHRYLRFAYYETDDYGRYLSELKRDAELTRNPVTLAEADAAEKGFARAGERGLLENQLTEQITLYEKGSLSPCFVANTEAKLGKNADVLKYLNLCVQAHDEQALAIGRSVYFTNLHQDPAFQQLLAQVRPVPELQK